ncbi:MAG TPA: indolepyruvate oxidoreductase subunit beta [Vicinamibacterales bacterium]|nr:indolepyruvate oxidoreductase subunit beta [Vicinamibacterales bacterium]
MKFDVIVAGVGGQGVLSLSSILAAAALNGGLFVKQSEVHGMAQRGGAVTAHLRLSSTPVHSELVALGSASMILSLEPLEALRHLEYLAPGGAVVTAVDPVRNIPNYPALDELVAAIRLLPSAVEVEAAALARRAGLARATNMVMAGAAAPWLPLRPDDLESCIRMLFASKGPVVVERNLAAFRAGREVSCSPIR